MMHLVSFLFSIKTPTYWGLYVSLGINVFSASISIPLSPRAERDHPRPVWKTRPRLDWDLCRWFCFWRPVSPSNRTWRKDLKCPLNHEPPIRGHYEGKHGDGTGCDIWAVQWMLRSRSRSMQPLLPNSPVRVHLRTVIPKKTIDVR